MLSLKDFDGVISHRGTPVKLPYEFSWNTPAIFSFITKEGDTTSDIILDDLKIHPLLLDGSEDLLSVEFLNSISKEWELWEKHIGDEKVIYYDLPNSWKGFWAMLLLVEDMTPEYDIILCVGSMGEPGRTSITGLLYKASIIYSNPVLRERFKK